jgi:hypothetical protein
MITGGFFLLLIHPFYPLPSLANAARKPPPFRRCTPSGCHPEIAVKFWTLNIRPSPLRSDRGFRFWVEAGFSRKFI